MGEFGEMSTETSPWHVFCYGRAHRHRQTQTQREAKREMGRHLQQLAREAGNHEHVRQRCHLGGIVNAKNSPRRIVLELLR